MSDLTRKKIKIIFLWLLVLWWGPAAGSVFATIFGITPLIILGLYIAGVHPSFFVFYYVGAGICFILHKGISDFQIDAWPSNSKGEAQ